MPDEAKDLEQAPCHDLDPALTKALKQIVLRDVNYKNDPSRPSAREKETDTETACITFEFCFENDKSVDKNVEIARMVLARNAVRQTDEEGNRQKDVQLLPGAQQKPVQNKCFAFENSREGFELNKHPKEVAKKALAEGTVRVPSCPMHGKRYSSYDWNWDPAPPCLCSPFLKSDYGLKQRYVWTARIRDPTEFKFCQCPTCVSGKITRYVVNHYYNTVTIRDLTDEG